MANGVKGDLGRHLIRLFGTGSATGLADSQLVQQLANRDRESAEGAFATILTRHGSMVLNVCRQVLGDHHAAEDAFQATFLVLLHRAGTLRVRGTESLGPWLHGVAYHTASKARRGRVRRFAPRASYRDAECRGGSGRPNGRARRSPRHGASRDQPAAGQVSRSRGALLSGRADACPGCRRVRWPVGTVRGRLARARDLLRRRLIRRGLAPAGMIGAALLEPGARAEVPVTLHNATVTIATQDVSAAAGLVSFVSSVLRNLFMTRLKMTTLTMALLASGVALVLGTALDVPGSSRSDPSPAGTGILERSPPNLPAYPLPGHALARLGTLEFLAKGPGLDYPSEFGQVLHSHDGKLLVTSIGTNACVWDAITGRLLHKITEIPGEIALSPDGATLAAFDADHRLNLWNVVTGNLRRRWHAMPGETYQGLSFSPDGLTLAACTGKRSEVGHTWEFITLWDVTSRTEYRRRLRVDLSYSTCFKLSADGKALVILEEVFRQPPAEVFAALPVRDRISLRRFDVPTGEERRRIDLPGILAAPFAFSADGTLLASSANDGAIRILDVASGQERGPKLGHVPRPQPGGQPDQSTNAWDLKYCLTFSSDGSILAVGGFGSPPPTRSQSLIHLWDLASGKELRHFPAHPDLVRSLSFAPDGNSLASIGLEPVIRLWEVSTGRERIPHVGHQTSIWCLAVSPTDGTVYTGGSDRTIRRWDPSSGRELGIVARLDLPACTMDFSPDGKILLAGTYRGVTLWNVADRREIRRLAYHDPGNWCHVAYSPDGKTVVAEGRVWDVATGNVLLTLLGPIPGPETNALNFGIPIPVNPSFGPQPAQKPEPPILDSCPIAYSPDGKQIITVQTKGIRIWDIASGRAVRRAVRAKLNPTNGFGHQTAFSADGRLVATCGGESGNNQGSIDRAIHIWDLASGREVAALEGVAGSTFESVAFSADGRLLASGSRNDDASRGGTVSVWEISTGKELRRFAGHREAVNVVAFTADDKSVVSGSDDATALVWDVNDLGPAALPDSDATTRRARQ